MADPLSHANPLDGVCGTVECGTETCIVCYTFAGLSFDNDGNSANHNGVGILRIDPRHRGPKNTEIVIHEFLHKRLPHWTEEAIDLFGEQLAALVHLPEVAKRSFGVEAAPRRKNPKG